MHYPYSRYASLGTLLIQNDGHEPHQQISHHTTAVSVTSGYHVDGRDTTHAVPAFRLSGCVCSYSGSPGKASRDPGLSLNAPTSGLQGSWVQWY